MISDVLRNFNAFVDGRGMAGKCEEFNPPKLTLKTEEHRAGGLDAPVEIDQGMEKLESDFTLSGHDRETIGLFGLAPGNLKQVTLRGGLQSEDGTVTPVIHNLTGMVKSVETGAFKAGEKSTLKISMALRYYKHTHGGTVVHEIDVENMKRIVNGVDQLAAMRAAIGL